MSVIVLCDFEWHYPNEECEHKCMLEGHHPEVMHLCDCGAEQNK